MKHIHYYIYALLFAAILAACSNDDFNDKLTTSDEVNGPITFSASAQTDAPTRAALDPVYRNWDSARDPQSMGVFGMLNGNKGSFGEFFDNQQVTYNASATDDAVIGWKAATKWRYTPAKYWPDYTWCNSYDFFAYMPYKEGTTIASTDGTNFTVTIPGVTLSQAVQTYIDNSPYLICNLPINKTVPGEVIEYKMDQTLAAFQIRFKLGQDMENVRDIFIKGVKIKGDLHKGGKIIRTYTWNNAESKWTSGKIEWKDLDTKTSANTTIAFANLGTGDKATYYNNVNSKLHIVSTDSLSWGKPFKVIPNGFNPTIEVTYDVTTNEVDNSTLTRKNVVSEIEFSNGFFEAAQTGKINPILINIVPSYLYVLADDDQKGYLIINQTATP